MKVRRVALAALGALVVLGVGFSAYALLTVGDGRETNAPQPSVAGAPANIKEPLARGEYLARVGRYLRRLKRLAAKWLSIVAPTLLAPASPGFRKCGPPNLSAADCSTAQRRPLNQTAAIVCTSIRKAS